MTYIHRSLERKFLKMSSAFKAVMVTGARQVGKSTMLKHLAQDTGRVYVSMDDADVRELANRDPKLFSSSTRLKKHPLCSSRSKFSVMRVMNGAVSG